MPYKYQRYFDNLALQHVLCPCEGAIGRDCIAFRLVRLPATDPTNFVPRPLEPNVPPRKIKVFAADASEEEIMKAEMERCNEWGISLFENPYAASRVAQMFPKAFTLHTHIAELQLIPDDGVCTPTDSKQHFNLHEETTANLGNRVLRALPR
jgi:hypothetical protein